MSKRWPTLPELVDIVKDDTDFHLDMRLRDLNIGDRNPYYAWEAIGICIGHRKEFPEWLLGYLAQCVLRMGSDEAKKATDLRDILPWIFDFPEKKPGPGSWLNPDYDPERDSKVHFASEFAVRIARGEEDALKAMRDAGEVAFADIVEDRTLWRWLLKEFDLKERPLTAAAWKAVVSEYYGSIWTMYLDHAERVLREAG